MVLVRGRLAPGGASGGQSGSRSRAQVRHLLPGQPGAGRDTAGGVPRAQGLAGQMGEPGARQVLQRPQLRAVLRGIAGPVLPPHGGEPVLVRSMTHMRAPYHPELADDDRVHQLFLNMVQG